MTEKYMAYLEVLESGEKVIGDIYDTDVYEWVMAPFVSLLVKLAPPPVTRASISGVLSETSPVRPSFVTFDDDFLDDLETWTALYDPAGIVLSFKDPEDALFKPPSKVLIDDYRTECFFKPCNSGVQIRRELGTYKMIHAAGLDSQFNLCHLYGIVMDEYDFILGILLTHIDNRGCPLSTKIALKEHDDPPPEVRQRWMDQIDAAVSGLHDAGIIWGDVKTENVLIDQDSNAWVTDFGGGYTKGWVDKEVAETMEGDKMGMAKLREFVFPAASKAEQ
ncbi:hypothetical protein FOC1_g10013398 [Fusarium oxysporum f. sp. cubense race 1]|uniref:Protein kinase domain-containing protein n=1 Tax=Fusarium oxysporum f. sp. cubense (strain race 1) TaxID=1229664 RepID=N4UVC9_FUSC1|nr:hypothetical protein FOC1_g10013398 [Fusarium oxysporum f. sp. cubense race 1]